MYNPQEMPVQPLHLLFAGTPAFAVPSLKVLAANPSFMIDLVITQPDKPVGRKGIVTPPPVKVAAQKLGIPVWQPSDINKEPMPELPNSPSPDYIVVVAYGQLLKQHLLDLPKIAPVNVHASLLPRWRGASPIQHAILMGDRETGVTIQRMVKALDEGPIISQESTAIGPRETFTELHDRLAKTGAHLLVQTLLSDAKPKPQAESGVTHCKKLTRASGAVDPSLMTAIEIDRRVRALNPWPGVTLDTSLKILATELQPTASAVPLLCKDDTTVYLVTVQPAGGKPMTGEEWARGKRK